MKCGWEARRSIRTGSWCRPPSLPLARRKQISRSSDSGVGLSIRIQESRMKTSILRLLAVGVGAMLLTSAYVRIPSSSLMETAAKNFLNSLTPEQRAQATYKFEDDERFDWHFIPKPRKGLPLREMTTFQTKLAHALLAAGLSQHGYIKAVSIMSLEDVLKQMEAGKTGSPGGGPEGYFFTVFGEPSSNGVWGYRVEGHHVSQNYTVIAGKVV